MSFTINLTRFLARATGQEALAFSGTTYTQESPPALTRKRLTDRGVTSPRYVPVVGGGGTLAGGVPWLGGYPGQGGTLAGGGGGWGTPHLELDRVPPRPGTPPPARYPPTWSWTGYPPVWSWTGYPPPVWSWTGYPPPISRMRYPPSCGQTHKVKI